MTPLALADAVALPPARPSPERVMRLLFGGPTPFDQERFEVRSFGAIGSVALSAIVEPMWQQGPHVIVLLDIAGLSLVWPPRLDYPDAGPTVLTDLVGWILPDHLEIAHPFRAPAIPEGAIPVALGAYLAAELADLGVHAGDRAAIAGTIARFEWLARQAGQGSGQLGLAGVTAHAVDEPAGAALVESTPWPALPPVGGVVADLVAICEHRAALDYNAGGYYDVTTACRLQIGCDRWTFVRVPRAIDSDPGIPLS